MKKLLYITLFICVAFDTLSQNINNDLLTACYENNEKEVFELLRRGANPNSQTIDGITALMYCVQNGNYILSQKLLEAGANPNTYGKKHTPALVNALLNNDTAIAILLLEYRANPDVKDYWTNKTPLILAIENENKILIESLLFYGANPNKQANEIPLIYSIFNDADTTTVELLLKYKANPNICDQNNKSPLMYAIDNDNYNNVNLLLKYKADPKKICTANQDNALSLSIKQNRRQITDLLLPYFADSLQKYHRTAISRDYAWASRKIRKMANNKFYKPALTHFCINMGLTATYDDYFFNFNFMIHESRYNVDLGVGIQPRIARKRVLIESSNNTFLQFWERRNIAKIFTTKYLPIFYTKESIEGIYIEAAYNKSFGEYDGSTMPINKVDLFSASIGYWFRFDFLRFRMGYEYLALPTSFVHKIKFDLTFLIGF